LATHAGAVECRRNRKTGTIMTLYRADEAGLETDPDTPWCTVCQNHNTLICSSSRKLARMAMAWPDWCEECQDIMAAKGLI
jgi:hypothetical protein